MPILVVGADTPIGQLVIDSLAERSGEVRAFVSSPEVATTLRSRGVKVALGDVSDGSHVGSAALNCFSTVFVAEAATDDRERAFASSAAEVFKAWEEALEMAHPTRVIWVGPPGAAPQSGSFDELALVDGEAGEPSDVAARVAYLDDLEVLPA